jgi:hypothetical protein
MDLHTVKLDLIGVMERQQARSRIKNLPFHEKSLSSSTAELNAMLTKLKLEPNWNLLKIARTFGAVDMNIGELNPDINYVKEMKAYHAHAQRRQIKLPHPAEILTKIDEFLAIVMPRLYRRALLFSGSVSTLTRIGAFLLRTFARALLVGTVILFWVSVFQNHYSFVDQWHEPRGWFTLFIRRFPRLSTLGWSFIMFIFLGCSLRLNKFVREITQPTHRLPGDPT